MSKSITEAVDKFRPEVLERYINQVISSVDNIPWQTWGGGFLDFGNGIREGSHAALPTIWDDNVSDSDSDSDIDLKTVKSVIDNGLTEDRTPEIINSMKAFVIYAESVAGPRWLEWEQPVRVIHDVVGFGSFVIHKYGFMIWKDDGEGSWDISFLINKSDSKDFIIDKNTILEDIEKWTDDPDNIWNSEVTKNNNGSILVVLKE